VTADRVVGGVVERLAHAVQALVLDLDAGGRTSGTTAARVWALWVANWA
jgi:hypothetical protein